MTDKLVIVAAAYFGNLFSQSPSIWVKAYCHRASCLGSVNHGIPRHICPGHQKVSASMVSREKHLHD
jgi:hypothetical protein